MSGRLEWDLARALVELPAPAFVVRERSLAFVNDAFAALFGVPRAALEGGSILDLCAGEDDRARLDARLERILAVGREVSRTVDLHHAGRSASLELAQGARVDFDCQPAVVEIGRDVTELRRLEARRILAEWLRLSEALASGLSHELSNPLTYVLGNVDMVRAELSRGDDLTADDLQELDDLLKDVREGAEILHGTIKTFRSLARVKHEERGPVDVQRLLDEVVGTMQRALAERAEVVRAYAPLPLVRADRARLAQALTNLLARAGDAVAKKPERGSVRIGVAVDGQGRVVVEVEDSGDAIPTTQLAHVFEPFSTRGPDHGIGLAVAYQIVTSLGGDLVARSNERGTTFTMSLPALE